MHKMQGCSKFHKIIDNEFILSAAYNSLLFQNDSFTDDNKEQTRFNSKRKFLFY